MFDFRHGMDIGAIPLEDLIMEDATKRVDEDSHREMMLISLEERYKDQEMLNQASLVWLAGARSELASVTRLLAYRGEFKDAQRFQKMLDGINAEIDRRRG